MPGYKSQRQGTARTVPKLILLFFLLFVCKCVPTVPYRTVPYRTVPHRTAPPSGVNPIAVTNVSVSICVVITCTKLHGGIEYTRLFYLRITLAAPEGRLIVL
jgi:hypothetical protein